MPVIDYDYPPSAELVEEKFKGANWWPSDAAQINAARLAAQMAIDGSINEFERLTKWFPFVSDGNVSEVRYFNKIDEHGCIRLGEGLLTLTSITVSGTTYTNNSNVFLMPENAAAKGEPCTYLRLWPANRLHEHRAYGNGYELRPRSIVITGEWGFSKQWPAVAQRAIVDRAAALILPFINREQELSGISEDGFSEQFDLVGPIDPKKASDLWGKDFETVAALYRKDKYIKPGPMSLSIGNHTTLRTNSYLPLP